MENEVNDVNLILPYILFKKKGSRELDLKMPLKNLISRKLHVYLKIVSIVEFFF